MPAEFPSTGFALETTLTAIRGFVDQLEGYTDGLEGLVTSSNTKLDTVHTDLATTLGGFVDGLEGLATTLNSYVDGLETLQTSGNTKLDTIHTDIATTLAGYVDGLEALTTTLNSYVDGLETLVTSSNTKLDTLHTDLATTLAGFVDGLEGYTDGLEGLLATENTNSTAISAATGATGDASSASTLIGLLKNVKASLSTLAGAVSGSSLLVDTELPAAFTPTDADPALAIPPVGGRAFFWDPTLNAGAGGWFRARGTIANGLLVTSPTLSDGTQKAINRGGAKGATAAADVTSTAEGADHQALDTQTYHGGAAIDPRDVLDRAARLLGVASTLQAYIANVSGSRTSTGDIVNFACQGYGSVGLTFTATLTNGTVQFEVSYDGGTTWASLAMTATSQAALPRVSVSNPASGDSYMVALPPHATHFRARVSAYTSGTAAVTAGVSASPAGIGWVGVTQINSALPGGTAQIGYTFQPGIWQDDTTTPLAGGATFTGTARDVLGVGANATFTSTSGKGHNEVRVSAAADVAGTLYLEVSRDNSTWRRVKGIALAAFDGTSVFYGEIVHKPSTRYVRLVFVNGGGAQGHFMAQSLLVSG